jgi:hypothetical protein
VRHSVEEKALAGSGKLMGFMERYIRIVDTFNRRVGRFAMYLIFALMGVLFWSSVTKYAGSPALWTLEFAQFIMVGYYLLGGAYSMQMGDHVRMDLIYGMWSPRRKAAVDSITVLFLIFYLCVLLLRRHLEHDLRHRVGRAGAFGLAALHVAGQADRCHRYSADAAADHCRTLP